MFTTFNSDFLMDDLVCFVKDVYAIIRNLTLFVSSSILLDLDLELGL
jgi:hypothetical protein